MSFLGGLLGGLFGGGGQSQSQEQSQEQTQANQQTVNITYPNESGAMVLGPMLAAQAFHPIGLGPTPTDNLNPDFTQLRGYTPPPEASTAAPAQASSGAPAAGPSPLFLNMLIQSSQGGG